jgi:trimeric autotransporter adhesin
MAILTISGSGGDDTIVINASGTDSGSYTINGGPAIAFSGVTQLAVNGGDGNDTLTIVNPAGGLFAPTGGIRYDGGGQPADTLEVLGGAAAELVYTAGATPDAGTLTHAGAAGTQTIDFAGIAPITDTVAAASLTILGTAGKDTITIMDGGSVGGAQTVQVSSPTFESIRFAHKAAVTINGLGGDDTVSFSSANLALAGTTTLNLSGVGTVTETGSVKVANLSVSATGNVTLDDSGNVVGTLAASVDRTLSFTDAIPLSIGSVGGTTGITTANHDVTLTADTLDVQQQINAGVGIVTLQPLSAGRAISLGGADSASQLGLSDAELDHVTAGVLRLGKSDAGAIGFDVAISPAGTTQLELVTAADIQDNNDVGADVSVSKLAMTAGTGIGFSGTSLSADIDTAASQIEARTDTGGMVINNAGAVTVGGVTGSLGGLHVVTSGDLFLFAGGTITLADTDGPETVAGGSGSGNVFLGAIGAVADVTSSVNGDAVAAPAGRISLQAGRDILLGTGGTNFDNDVLANDTVVLQAGRDIVIDGLSDVASDAFGNSTYGHVTTVAGRNIAVANMHGNSASIGAIGGGSVNLITGADGFLTLTVPDPGALFSNSGDVTVDADHVSIASGSGITAAAVGHSVTIEQVSPAWAVNLGSTTEAAASTLELSDAELDRVFTPTLRIGRASNTGDIIVSSQITTSDPTLSLRTHGGIVDGTAGEQADITVGSLALRAATGIGSAGDLDVAVSNLAFDNITSGNVVVVNTAGLTIGAVDGLVLSSDDGGVTLVTTTGALTVAAPVASDGGISFEAIDTAAPGDDLTVLAGVALQSVTGAVQLLVGDNLTLQAGSTVQTASYGLFLVDFENADAGVGATATLNGTLVAPAVLNGNADADTLIGSAIADQLDGGGGADTMIGGAGDDTYAVNNAGDVVIESAGEGTDTVFSTVHFALSANVESLTLQGSADLQGYGNGLVNTITGNIGNNLLDGGAGADLMIGSAGNDTYFVDDAGDMITENLSEGTDAVFSTAHFALPANVETLVLQGSADLQGYGNGLVNTLYGNSGNNLLDGGAAADVMIGGIGNDTYFVDNAADAVVENAAEGNDAVFSTAHYRLSANVETLVLQGTPDLQGYGNGQVNTLYGNSGSNLLNGGAGADLMVGGAGNDTYFVDDPSDAVFESPGEGSDAVFSSAHYGLAADVETLVLQGGADLQGYGNNQANTLYGNTGNNLLNGAGGADTMYGAIGNDTYFVDNGLDQVVENAAEGADVVLSTVHFILPTNVETLVLQGSAAANGTGNALANAIFGNSADNRLDGQGGTDTLTGNAGNDTFVFVIGQGGGDTVVDFTGNGAAVGDSLQFIGYGAGATFTNIDPTHWQVNYNAGASHEIITLMNGASVHPSDVLFS